MITAPIQLETQRLRLRAPILEDVDAIYEEYATDHDVTRYVTWVPHKSRVTVAEFVRERIERFQTGQEFSWVITLPSDNRPIGMIGARVRGHTADIGYVLSRNHWSHDYMTEAVSALAQWLLDQPGVFRVWAVCDIENIGSARVLEKSHFEREGLLRRWIIHPNRSSEPRDVYIYGRGDEAQPGHAADRPKSRPRIRNAGAVFSVD